MKKFKLAIVHDDFIQQGGAEFLVFELLQELSKLENISVKVYSSIINYYWKEKFNSIGLEYQESFLAKIPFSDKISKLYFLSNLFYLAFESFDFSEYDVVFSSSTRFGHSIITKPSTLHISYLNSPSKMLWEVNKYYYGKKFIYNLVKNFLPDKRIYDFVTQQRADMIIANSKNILKKIKKIYQRDSIILYPFKNGFNNQHSKYTTLVTKNSTPKYVLISRIVPWKRINYVIETFNLNQENLVIIGKGDKDYLKQLKSQSKPNIRFLGYVSDEEKTQILSSAKALIVSQDEDFGLVIVEALSLGTPIIYYNQGGAKEILSSEYGESFESQNSSSLQEALNNFKSKTYSKNKLREYAQKFSSEHFIKEIIKMFNSKV